MLFLLHFYISCFFFVQYIWYWWLYWKTNKNGNDEKLQEEVHQQWNPIKEDAIKIEEKEIKQKIN